MNEEGFTNLFSFIIFIIILILFLYFVYKQIKNIFKIENENNLNQNNNEQNNNEQNNNEQNNNEPNNNEPNNKKEEFMNLFSLNDFLFDVDEDGNFIEKDKKEENNKQEENKKKILENVIHKKNLEIKERENNENTIIKDKENKKDQKKEDQKEEKDLTDSIIYIVDKNSNKKHIHFTILNEKKLKYLDCNGFYDDHIMINVKDVKNREITKIINKIYNKYTFVYQTKNDNEPINYFIEYRPSQERFIKLYNQNEDKVFYLEKIFYKEHKKDTNNKSIPLYKIYYYANEIGTIYSNLVEDNNTKVYQMRLNYENGENNKNIIAFSFILYLSFLKEEF